MVLYEEADVSGSAVNAGFNRRIAAELRDMEEQGVYKTLLHIMGMQGAVVELDKLAGRTGAEKKPQVTEKPATPDRGKKKSVIR